LVSSLQIWDVVCPTFTIVPHIGSFSYCKFGDIKPDNNEIAQITPTQHVLMILKYLHRCHVKLLHKKMKNNTENMKTKKTYKEFSRRHSVKFIWNQECT
jgi:hypothetical protein